MTVVPVSRSGHPVSAAGVLLSTVSALSFALLWLLDAAGWIRNPYVGLVAFIVIPTLFVAGLLLIPLGIWLARRRARRGLPSIPVWPRLDLNDSRTRRLALIVLMVTTANVMLLAVAGYEAVHYLDSPAFCGQLCHAPMAPQFTQWRAAPHASVDCVSCHVGSERGSFLKAKIAGTRRLAHMITGTYPRPIHANRRDLPGTAFTCEQCHSQAAFTGDRLRVIRTHADDEASTPSDTTLRMYVGPRPPESTEGGNIHWHAQPGRTIEFVEGTNADGTSDDTIPWVRVTEADGRARTFIAEGAKPDEPPAAARERMDCLSCHNRPAHPFSSSADKAVDTALADGSLTGAIAPSSLPYLRREAIRALAAPEGADRVEQALRGFYASTYPALAASRAEDIARVASSLQALSRRSVFPSMRVTWGTYASYLGHTESPGCFRCHDDGHKAADGAVIRQDCVLCHAIVE